MKMDATWHLPILQMKYCTEHSAAAMRAAVALSKWDPILRPVAAMFIPEMRDLRRRFNILRDFVTPIHKVRSGTCGKTSG